MRRAREHNLKNVSLDIPRNQLVVITGLSGSGKSSLAFDTIYAEDSAAMWKASRPTRASSSKCSKSRMSTLIEGLSPAISIEQKTTSKNPRSNGRDGH